MADSVRIQSPVARRHSSRTLGMKPLMTPSKAGALLVILGVMLMLCSGCLITSRPPTVKYFLTNSLPVEIQVDAFDRHDKCICHRSVAPGREVNLGHARRLEVHKSSERFEYALPSNPEFWTPPNKGGSPYISGLGGQCYIAIDQSGYLAFISLKGSMIVASPDESKPPLGFPVRPR